MSKKIIGIDTGGTYTDIVVIDAETRKILVKNKTLTTKNDLKACIEESFESVPGEMFAIYRWYVFQRRWLRTP